nr:fibro-slime domain-containing protein [uncultured Caproiciproducens sp.]
MSAIKKLQLRTTSLILTFAILTGCVFTTAVTRSAFAASDSGHDSGHDSGNVMGLLGVAEDQSIQAGIVTFPVNVYKYNTDSITVPITGSGNKTERAINLATRALYTSGKRALYFGGSNLGSSLTGSGNGQGAWNTYNSSGSIDGFVYPGIVQTELTDATVNGQLRFDSKYVQSDFFGAAKTIKDRNNVNHPDKTVYENSKFQFRLGTDGYYSYDSEEDSATFDATKKKIEIAEQEEGTTGDARGFWPFGSQECSFGLSMGMEFLIPKDGQINDDNMVFQFSGDDDVWVFVDGKLALDIGGIHRPRSGSINFNSGLARVDDYVPSLNANGSVNTSHYGSVEQNIYDDLGVDNSDPTTKHTIKIFYMERGDGGSNCNIRFNIPTTTAVTDGGISTAKTATATAKEIADRTYNINLKAWANPATVTGTYKPYDPQHPPEDGPYYLDDDGETEIKYKLEGTQQNTVYKWYKEADFSGSEVQVTAKGDSTPLYIKTAEASQTDTPIYSSALSTSKHYYVGTSKTEVSYRSRKWRDINNYNSTYTPKTRSTDTNSSHYQFYDRTTTVDTYAALDEVPYPPVSGTNYYILSGGKYIRVYFKATIEEVKEKVWYKGDTRLNPQPDNIYAGDSTGGSTDGTVEGATVKDYIDPRFMLIDDDNDALEDGDTVADDGILHIPGSGNAYIVWTDQTIPVSTEDDPDAWEADFKVQAKPEFIGGNDIPTNADGSGVFKNDAELKSFDIPTVNVKPVFYLDNEETTIFRGEEVPDSTLAPYTLDRDGHKVTGGDIFCGKGSTGDFSYQWFKAEWQNGAWAKNDTALASSAAFPTAITPDDSTFYMLVATFDPSADGTASADNCGDYIAGDTPNKTVPNDKDQPNGVYTANVVKGQLLIGKTITNKYPAPDSVRAKQSFVFKVERRDHLSDVTPADTFYEVITLDSSLSGSKTITGLKKGFYKVTEETGDAWRYTQTAVNDTDVVTTADYSSTSADQKMYIGRLTSVAGASKAYYGAAANDYHVTPNPAEISFTNTLAKGKWLGDTTVKVNTISAAVPAV